MRVLFVSPYFEPAQYYGGPVNSNFTLCKALARQGVETVVFTTNADGKNKLDQPLRRPIMNNGLSIWYFPLLSDFMFYSPELVSAVKHRIIDFDIAFFQLIWSHALRPVSRISLRSKVPYIIPLRGQLLPWALSHKPIRKKVYLNLIGRGCLNRAAGLYCTHLTEENSVKGLNIKAPTFVVNNMVDEIFFGQRKKEGFFTKRFGINGKFKIVTFLGRIDHKKRPDIAWLSLPKTKIMEHSIHLVFAGPDQINFIPWLRSEAARAGLADHVHFTGPLTRQDVFKVLCESDVVLMPSESASENFGMSAAEALTAGVPIITSPGVPVGEMAQEARAGFVINNNPVEIKNKIIEILSHPDLSWHTGQNGRRLANQEFNPDILVGKMIRHLEAFIHKKTDSS